MAIDLVNVAAGTGGFVIYGENAGDLAGISVSSAGDVNGDGFDDLIIGAGLDADFVGSPGECYVVFGHAGGFSAEIDLSDVAAGTGGFVIHGQDVDDNFGSSVSSAGDVNGDGFDDLIVGAKRGDGPSETRDSAGDSYVVFGHAGAFAAEIDLDAIAAGAGGFVIHGQDADDLSGFSVSSAGDINNDGFDDLVIGAPEGDGPGNTRDAAGDTYVVFGHAGGFAAQIALAAIAVGTGGFVIHGENAVDNSGISVASAGDINGDGFDDLIIGAEGDDSAFLGLTGPVGASYVVYGHAGGFAAEIDLAAIAAGTGGFVIRGQDPGDNSGSSASSAGDINGDGFDDLIIGAKNADGPSNTRDRAGDSYVVFGHAGAFAAEIDLAAVAGGIGGFVIHGEDAGDVSGAAVASAGDVNGDGFDDLIIGAFNGGGPSNTRTGAGDTYVLFGHAGAFGAEIDLAAVAGGIGGFVIHGQDGGQFLGDGSGFSVASAGDINGDGFDDLIIGAPFGDGPANTRPDAGETYVLFGSAAIGSSQSTPYTAADIFAAIGQLDFMGELANAAYRLRVDSNPNDGINSSEVIANDVNNPDGPTVGPSFALVDQYLHLLTTADMPTLALHASGDSRYPLTGLENGVYTDGNAAALIGRSADALFVSFRGTNDVDGVIDTLLQNTPDSAQWSVGAKSDHYALFADLRAAITQYVNDPANGITTVYVTGHSLGGGRWCRPSCRSMPAMRATRG